MNKDQEKMIDAVILVDTLMRTPAFTQDINAFKDLTYHFGNFVNSIRLSIGQYKIKEYLND